MCETYNVSEHQRIMNYLDSLKAHKILSLITLSVFVPAAAATTTTFQVHELPMLLLVIFYCHNFV